MAISTKCLRLDEALTPQRALEMLASANAYIEECLEAGHRCNCNHCYFCAYNVLKEVIEKLPTRDAKGDARAKYHKVHAREERAFEALVALALYQRDTADDDIDWSGATLTAEDRAAINSLGDDFVERLLAQQGEKK